MDCNSLYNKTSYVITMFFFVAYAYSAYGSEKISYNEPAVSKKQVLEAVESGADYAINTLLDDDHKSKCDYNLTEGVWYDYEVPWHTGQIIYGLLEAHRITRNEKYLSKAKLAGDWWISLEIKDHPKLEGMINAIHGDTKGDVILFATMTNGSGGIYELSRITKDKKYANIATRAGEWMIQHMYIPEKALCYDYVDPETGVVLTENSSYWPKEDSVQFYDIARPNNEGSLFLDMYNHTGNEIYKEAFLNLCDGLVNYQDKYSLWMQFRPNRWEDNRYHPRFNLWYAESLLEGYELTRNEMYLQSAKKTAQRFAEIQDKTGAIYYSNYVDGRPPDKSSVTGSAVSFAAILWIRLIEYGVGEEFKDNVELAAQWVYRNRFASGHPDENLRGAFMNIRARQRKGKVWLVNRDIGTSFGLRFLAAYYDYHNYGKTQP